MLLLVDLQARREPLRESLAPAVGPPDLVRFPAVPGAGCNPDDELARGLDPLSREPQLAGEMRGGAARRVLPAVAEECGGGALHLTKEVVDPALLLDGTNGARGRGARASEDGEPENKRREGSKRRAHGRAAG